jgi:hypothetical protein
MNVEEPLAKVLCRTLASERLAQIGNPFGEKDFLYAGKGH